MNHRLVAATIWIAGCGNCGRSDPRPGALASEAECRAWVKRVAELDDASDPAVIEKAGLSEAAIQGCRARMTSEEVACWRRARSIEEGHGCWTPSMDSRPVDQRLSPDECAAWERHLRGLVGDTDVPGFADRFGEIARMECDRWLRRDRFECGMEAVTMRELAACEQVSAGSQM